MDLNDFNIDKNANDGRVMQLAHPVTGKTLMHDGNPMCLKLLGSDSDAFREKAHEIQVSQLERKAAGGSISQTKDEVCELLASCTTGFENVNKGGKILEYSEPEAFILYVENSWIRDQVDKFMGDRANFF